MITILLTILKVLGILLLILLITVLTLLFLVLFVPVRYRVALCRKEGEENGISVNAKVSWLLHLVNASFCYPQSAFLRVRVFCFTLFRSDRLKPRSDQPQKAPSREKKKSKAEKPEEKKKKKTAEHAESTTEAETKAETETKARAEDAPQPTPLKGVKGLLARLKEFFRKLRSLFQNIRYTITQICDKIKHIANNIQYYLNILKSDTFSRAWKVCSGQAFSLLKSIFPGKWRGSLVIGTGDPAGTGQLLAVYGMPYPLLGAHISVTPDFERKILEGELFAKGKITVFRGLKTAWKIYFNKDLRHLIKLFKREAA